MFTANFHTHSVFCDGSDTPEDIVLFALSQGMTHLGFSGHMDPDIHMDWEAYCWEIYRLKAVYGSRIDIFCGAELDNLYDPASIREADGSTKAEYTIGSTHFLDVPSAEPLSVDNTPQHLETLCREFFGGDYYALSAAYYELESQVFDRLKCTFVGHFDLITRFNDDLHFLDESDPRYLRPALEAMEYLVSKDVPFEINCGAVNRGRKKELYPCQPLLKALYSFGGEIIINSDAHCKELLTGGFDQAAAAAVRCGFTHTNILEHTSGGGVSFRQIPLDLPLSSSCV